MEYHNHDVVSISCNLAKMEMDFIKNNNKKNRKKGKPALFKT